LLHVWIPPFMQVFFNVLNMWSGAFMCQASCVRHFTWSRAGMVSSRIRSKSRMRARCALQQTGFS